MSSLYEKKGSTFSTSIFLASTTLGAGFLWLPTVTGIAGFWPAIFLTLLAWAYLTASALLYMEAILCSPDGANAYTICKHLTGKFGGIIGALSFAILNCPFVVAFYALGFGVLNALTEELFASTISFSAVCVALALFGAIILFLGAFITDRIILILSAAAIIAFIVVLIAGSKGINLKLLEQNNWYFSFFALGSLLSLMGSNSLLPTLASHLGRNPAKCRRMIVIGMTIPLIIALVWQWVTIGTIPKGTLWIAYQTRGPFSLNLDIFKHSLLTRTFFNFFLFFAFITSFLGISLAVLDFFADLFGISLQKRVGWKRVWLCVGLFGISGVLGYLLPGSIMKVITQMGGWSEAFFNGLLPVWLVVAARYTLKLEPPTMLFGGKSMITIMAIATFFALYLQGVQLIQ